MQEKLLYRVTEAAELLGISRAKLYQLIARGELRAVHIDSAARIPAAELERYVRELQSAAGVA
ncbi:MAG: helix-turn-helix domain-containing protein [Chloroflexi bacterium]|nr:helix-turn-helix domain-containing protein [Chloroflexota bacterium]